MKPEEIVNLIKLYIPVSDEETIKKMVEKIKKLPDNVIKQSIDEYFRTYHPDDVMLLHLSADADTILNECNRISKLTTPLTPYEKTLFVDVCINPDYWSQRLINEFGYKKEQLRKLDRKTKEDTLFALISEYKNNTGFDIMVCGANDYGQLGLGDNNDRNVLTRIPDIKAKKVVRNYNYTVIIDMSDSMWVCGDNRYQLGLGDNNDRNILTRVPNIKAKEVACGKDHIVVIDASNDMWVCGHNVRGQLGLGDNMSRNVFTHVPNIKAKEVACGAYHTVMIDLINDVYVCGYNNKGQLGLRDKNDRNVFTQLSYKKSKKVACGDNYTVIIDTSSKLWVCGENNRGQLGLSDNKDRYNFQDVPFISAKDVSCGNDHTIVINVYKSKERVYVCGNNNRGQLGLGDNKDRNVFTEVSKINSNVKEVACGYNHTVIINTYNNVYVCGRNDYGQLGFGDNNDRKKFERLPDIKAKKVACGSNHTIALV